MIVVCLITSALALIHASNAQSGCESVSYKQVDLIFVLDGSSSVGSQNFVKMIDFVKNVVRRLPVGPSETSVGVFQYTSIPEDPRNYQNEEFYSALKEVALGSIQNSDQLITQIDRIRYINGTTYTGKAISAAFNHFGEQGRKGIPKAMVVITDGKSIDDVSPASELAHFAKVTIIPVGVAEANAKELRVMAGSSGQVFSLNNFNEMVDFVDTLAVSIQSVVNPACMADTKVSLITNPKKPYINGRKVDLICEVKNALANMKYNFYKDNQIISTKLTPVKVGANVKITYSITISAATAGVYQCQVTTETGRLIVSNKQDILKVGRRMDLDTGESIRIDEVVIGSGSGISAMERCARCPGYSCSLFDGQQCAEEYLQCNYRERPKGLSKCEPGKLFFVDDAKNKKFGSCVSAAQCRRERLRRWIRHI